MTFLDATSRARSCRLCCKTPFAQLIAKLGTEFPLGRRLYQPAMKLVAMVQTPPELRHAGDAGKALLRTRSANRRNA